MSARGYLRGFTERGISFDIKSQTFYLHAPNAAAEEFLDRRYPRTEDGSRWRHAKKAAAEPGEVKTPSWPRRIYSYSRSQASKAFGPADEATVAQRMLSCFGNAETAECPSVVRDVEGRPFCNDCGCGRRPEAELAPTEKLGLGYAWCPRRKPGFSNEVRP